MGHVVLTLMVEVIKFINLLIYIIKSLHAQTYTDVMSKLFGLQYKILSYSMVRVTSANVTSEKYCERVQSFKTKMSLISFSFGFCGCLYQTGSQVQIEVDNSFDHCVVIYKLTQRSPIIGFDHHGMI